MMEWTARVDAKAAFALTLQSAILAAVAAFVAGGSYGAPKSWIEAALLFAGLVLLTAGAVVAAVVVAPSLRGKRLRAESRRDHIYFGHVRNLTSDQLERRLKDREILPVLSRQIVRMSEILWTKHVRVQWALWLAVTGGLCMAAMLLARALAVP